jgi:hypothetical protein
MNKWLVKAKDVPGNFISRTGTRMSFWRRCWRREVWVVLPERSRPSMTMNGARRNLGGATEAMVGAG